MSIEDSHYKPEDFNVPDRFRHYADDTAEDNIGPFFSCTTPEGAETALRVAAKHCNIMGICHGGVLMALADYTLGMTLYAATKAAGVTIYCNNEFLSSAKQGALVIGHGTVKRETGSLAFLKAELFVDDELILSCSGAYKKLKKGYDEIQK